MAPNDLEDSARTFRAASIFPKGSAVGLPVTILQEAATVVDGPRRLDYGTPLDNHSRTAAMWAAYLGVPITARDVCMLNVLQKASRDRHGAKRDNLVDIAGYARNAELCETPAPAPVAE